MRRLWWSSVIPLLATLCLTFTEQVASAQTVAGTGPDGPFEYNMRSSKRQPGFIDPRCFSTGADALPPGSPQCNSQAGREWEGTASTDYFTYEPSIYSPPNPDIAVGPDDILTIVNRTISRYPNPNAARFDNNGGTAPVAYSVPNTSLYYPTSRQFLDVWLGETALAALCPTQPRSAASCVIDNASVRYDQLQGRFLVLFTVVDTGLINCSGCQGTPNPQGRRASWVLIASRWATGCQGTVTSSGVNIGSCTPNTTPATPGIPGNTEFFTTPQPPGPSQSDPNSGGANSNWMSYYGAADGTCQTGCPNGNINSISDVRVGGTILAPGAKSVDCGITAVGDTARVCYFPTSARLGLDNDNIVINSSVYDDNIALVNRGQLLDANDQPTGRVPAFEGTRTRVHKKAGFYRAKSSVNNGTAMIPGAAQRDTATNPLVQGDFYDLWGNSAEPIGTAPFPTPSGYTHDKLVRRLSAAVGTQDQLGCHFEPDHVRGRSLATYNGRGGVTVNGGLRPFSTIWCAVDTIPGSPAPQNLLYHREITYSRTDPGPLATNTDDVPPTVAQPLIVGGIPRLEQLRSHIVPAFSNPQSVTQRTKLATGVTPYLYVGDDRPHRVISREGHRYIARVGFQADLFQFGVPGTASGSTVIYDIVQKLTQGGTAGEVYNTAWGNGHYYSPMHDTPANVVQYGSVSPINTLPFLEKLFVGTTYPPLAPSDPRTFQYGNFISSQALVACKQLDPSVTTGETSRAYPGLFDIRCGEDAYDTAQAYRHPTTGSFLPADFRLRAQPEGFPEQIVPFGIRGGAATDPNNLGLWLYGAYAKGRLSSIPGAGQWGTYVAHYPLTFPLRDPYNNAPCTYSDVAPGTAFYSFIQIAKQTEIEPGSRTACGTAFGVNDLVRRDIMARWLIRAQMDEQAITDYLNATGGAFASFADVDAPASSGTVTNTSGVANNWRYIETAYRRGYTKGCQTSNDAQRMFCPTRNLSRGEMAVFVIRAKMNEVFPTVTSGAFVTSGCVPPGTTVAEIGDLFGLFVGCNPYFSDVPSNHVFFAFIQKMRELRITIGVDLGTGTTLGRYDPEGTLTKGQLMTFLVRAFFP